ncbi:right-handed parallel beta-helix repeat-containing protein [Pyxidicoccus fallax]|uniref:Right-handed parallel beta-helix repeat-containing protein n=1 Tax=Pyxidicoccus fallax TaxID=394095 RepID=A0A848LGR7_9BACT|nr:right-handed parallel beta-helix repeat-containing protein [Pyxidicoccus fallax]NMO15288.1 right-handed parallel beta-helix repeat-containing protein [Pyxidicoccus fallax]NPC78434.1 right-handed parallel beta-helix repeat-containing protein [Pyxidicoccus fallax]
MYRADMKRLALLVGALVLVTTGCHLEEEEGINLEPSASARVVVALPRSLPAEAVSRVQFSTGGGADAGTGEDLTFGGSGWEISVRGVESGERATLRATVLDPAGAESARVEVRDVELPRHRPVRVVLVPQAPVTGEPTGNAAPFIDAVVAGDAVPRPGAKLELRAVAHDPNPGEALTYAWRATGGSFSDETIAAPEWTAPVEMGPVMLTLQVTDARGAVATLDFPVPVGVERDGGEAVFNRWPSLAELAAQPTRVSDGSPVALEAVGVDDDGDALTYAWTATCEGTFDDPAAAQASFTPTRLPEAACNNCRLSLVVSDEYGGRREGAVELCVERKAPPIIESTEQPSQSAQAGQLMRLRATATDPQNEPLDFTWTASTGLLGTPVQAGNSGEVDWTALSCLPAGVEPTVRLTVTNASGLSASHTFAVQWGDRRCGRFPPCTVTMANATVTLGADCETESTVFIPDGYTFDGAGRVLTAEDPQGGRFRGAVLRNRGTTAHVRGVTVAARGLRAGPCDGGADALSGIRLEGASGSIVGSEVRELVQEGSLGGCQEGTAIEVRNAVDAAEPVRVDVLRNQASGYQKGGIVVAGRVVATVEGNALDGGGPVAAIARNGIQVSSGATGRVVDNTVRGHAYTGPGYVASGIVVVGGSYYGVPLSKNVVIQDNELADNDVGINLSQLSTGEVPPSEPTNIQLLKNRLSSAAVTNGMYQAAISDYGRANVISRNDISGPGYDRATRSGVTFDVDVVAEAASEVVFLTPELRVAAGTCSGALVVQSQDAAGNLSALASSALVVRTESAGVTFYADAACTEALPASGAGRALTLEASHQEAVFYFRAAQAGAVTVTVAGDGVSASQAQTVE